MRGGLGAIGVNEPPEKMEMRGLIRLCKSLPKGPDGITAVKRRTELSLLDPSSDPLTERLQKIIKLVDFDKFKSVLDVGCFGGYMAHRIPHGYTGIDFYEEAIVAAKKLAKERNIKAQFRVGDLFDEKGIYDLVWCTQITTFKDKLHDAVAKLKSLGKWHVIALSGTDGDALPEGRQMISGLYVWTNLP